MPLSWLACPLTAPAGGGQGKGKRESGTGPIRCPGATWPGAGARGGRAVGGDVPRLGPLPRIVREEARWVGVRAVGTAPAPVSRESTSLSRERLTLRLPWGGGGGRTTLQEGLPEHLVEGQRATGVCRLRPGRLSVTGTPGPHPRAADPGLPSPCTGHSALWGFPGTVLPPSLLLHDRHVHPAWLPGLPRGSGALRPSASSCRRSLCGVGSSTVSVCCHLGPAPHGSGDACQRGPLR